MSEVNDQPDQATPAAAESKPEAPVAAPAEATPAPAPTATEIAATSPGPAMQSAATTPAPYTRPSYEGQSRRPPGGGGGRRVTRRKVCQVCADKMDFIYYKETKSKRKFMTDRGKILPRRITGNCATHQRMLTSAIKRARVVALVPFKTD